MKVINETIIITDPCYFVKDEDWDERVYDDYDLSHIGFNDYLLEDTVYGDWSCVTLQTDDPDIELTLQDNFECRDWKALKKMKKNDYQLGSFCADAGLVAVILEADLEKYDKNALEDLKKRPYLATFIDNYTGDIKIACFDSKYKSVIGNNFYTLEE